MCLQRVSAQYFPKYSCDASMAKTEKTVDIDAAQDGQKSGSILDDTRHSKNIADQGLVPIAAIGASAGGLEPIEQFFDSMPPDTGCAFVIIQHLSPDFRSLMDELLARHSAMDIHRINDGMEIKPNSIYLNPPRSVMTVQGNYLLVEKITLQDTVYLPIDIFFQSLADARDSDSIALVLSGTGTDGTKGSMAIEHVGGQVLVQDPKTTRFDGMPRSTLADGFSSLTASPSVLAECVQRLLKNESLDGLNSDERLPVSDPLSDVLSMLKHSHGTDFLQYKEATIHRRIERRAQMRGLSDINEYRDILSVNSVELQDLYADLLIEVTEFFRDYHAFELLQKQVIPELTADLRDGGALRVWVPGCASGEEAYSIAILLLERARDMGIHIHLKIMATDIHVRSMSQASSGIYDMTALSNLTEDLVNRYFDCADGQAQIKPSVRNMVFFSTHDVTRDPPFTRIDLVSCRNLLIYLKENAQQKVMSLLHFSLRKDGYLFLGPSEHIGAIAHEFDAVSEKWRIYKKRRDVKLLAGESIFHQPDLTSTIARAGVTQQVSNKKTTSMDNSIPFRRAYRAALEAIVARYAPAGFLLSDLGEVIHIFGNAGDLIPLQSGTFSKRIIELIRPELKVIVTAALDHSKYKDFSSFKRTAYIQHETGPATSYEISLVPMELAGEAQKFMLLSIEQSVVVREETKNGISINHAQQAVYDSTEELQARIAVLEHNLQSSEENLQSTIEELETSNEELQSTNEELMSTNEELQSTNEELHSVNEELYTVSAEHQRKNEELTDRETDIGVLLQSSKIGTLHLDESLNLLRYSNHARSVFNILPQDVGRPIGHITLRTNEQNLFDLIDRANNYGEVHETQVEVDNSVFLLRILPYIKSESVPDQEGKTSDNSVLVTVIDITDVETVRSKLAELNSIYRDVVEHTGSFVCNWSKDTGQIVFCNESFASRLNSTPEKLLGKDYIESVGGDNIDEFRSEIAKLSANEHSSKIYSRTDDEGVRWYANVYMRAHSNDGQTIDEYHCIGFDCTSEYTYRSSLDNLFTVFADESLSYEEKLYCMLEVGVHYLRMDTGIVCTKDSNTGKIICSNCNAHSEYCEGAKLDLTHPFCSFSNESTALVSFNNLADSQFSESVDFRKAGINRFVGTIINTANGPYGTLCFSSENSSHKPFSHQQNNFALVLGNWIGFLIGSQEQIDFISNQNDYYKRLFQKVPSMMFLCDAQGVLVSASDRLCSRMGWDRELIQGENCYDMLSTSDVDALTNAITQGDAHRLPLSIQPDNGTTIDVELNSNVKSAGALKGMRMVVLTDVSDRNRATDIIKEQNRSLEAANENLNQFAFIASHDLQEPLRKIQQFSSLLNEELKSTLSDEGTYHLHVIVDAAERMSTLIYDLLRYSGASQEQPKMENISLSMLLEEVISELDISINESQAKITVEKMPEVLGNVALLRQLFTNLISNSIKYRSKERPLEITIKSLPKGPKDGIQIADNGIGFEMEFAEKIFEPFNRLHKSKDYKGNGIGLAICNTVCQKHNWSLTADSKLGVGSEFTISFLKDELDAGKNSSNINGR